MADKKKPTHHATQLGLFGREFDQDYVLTEEGELVPVKAKKSKPGRRTPKKHIRREGPAAFRHRSPGEE